MLRSRLAGVLVAVLLATACGKPAELPAGPAELPVKPADYVEVFTWSQGIPPGAKALAGQTGTFQGPHFAYQFGALAVRTTLDETSGGLEVGVGRAAPEHEFLVLYRLQGDLTYAPPPEGAPLGVDVLVGTVRKRLPRQILAGTGIVVSVPTGADATLEVTDDKPYQYSVRNGNGSSPPVSSGPVSSGPPDPSAPGGNGKSVRWQDGNYSAQAAYQGVRTSGPLAVTAELGTKAELGADLAGAGKPPAGQVWLRFPDAKIATDDADLKLDLNRSFVLTPTGGGKISARTGQTGLLFAVPEKFAGGTLTITPEFPANSTAKWSTKPEPKEIPLTVS